MADLLAATRSKESMSGAALEQRVERDLPQPHNSPTTRDNWRE
jgi:hypothetical protein